MNKIVLECKISANIPMRKVELLDLSTFTNILSIFNLSHVCAFLSG